MRLPTDWAAEFSGASCRDILLPPLRPHPRSVRMGRKARARLSDPYRFCGTITEGESITTVLRRHKPPNDHLGRLVEEAAMSKKELARCVNERVP